MSLPDDEPVQSGASANSNDPVVGLSNLNLMAAKVAQVAWKSQILASLEKNSKLPYAKYMQIATVKPNGRPANRTVVFRGFFKDTEELTFTTDRRSHKVEDVERNNATEVCWYFPDSCEQFRLAGALTIVHADHPDEELLKARQQSWNSQTDRARTQFGWPHPGLLRTEPEEAWKPDSVPTTEETPLPDFCLGIVKVDEVDIVRLKPNTRTVFTRHVTSNAAEEGATWEEQQVNP